VDTRLGIMLSFALLLPGIHAVRWVAAHPRLDAASLGQLSKAVDAIDVPSLHEAVLRSAAAGKRELVARLSSGSQSIPWHGSSFSRRRRSGCCRTTCVLSSPTCASRWSNGRRFRAATPTAGPWAGYSVRLILALRLHAIDHGRLPGRLDDLVPELLPADPFDGKPLRWVREKHLVYSVGADLADDGGSEDSDIVATGAP